MRFNLLPDRDGYSVQYSNQCIKETDLNGGPSAKRLDFIDVTYLVDCQFKLTPEKFAYFNDFLDVYYDAPQWFDMLLVIEPYIPLYPIRNYKAQIIPGSDKLVKVEGLTFTVAMRVECYLDDIPLTSKPYPTDTHESLSMRSSVVSGDMKITNHTQNIAPNENVSVGASVISGDLRALLRAYLNWPHENVSVSMAVISGELRVLLRSYGDWPHENVSIGASVISGDIAVKLQSYTNWPHENLSVGMTVISGSLI